MQEEIYKNLSLEDLPGEEWKEIPEGDGMYLISSLGRVKSFNTVRKFGNKTRIHKGRIIKQFPNWQGYLSCYISNKNGEKINIRIHKWVANLFVPNPNNYPCVNHKDENKQNNDYRNLEHCSYSYNITYGSRKGEKDIPVVQYTLHGDFVREFNSTKEASETLNIQSRCTTNCTNGWSKSAGGYVWKKKSEVNGERIEPYIHPVKKKVNCYDLDMKYISSYESIADAARKTGLCVNQISLNCRNKLKHVKDFIFKYA